MNTGCVLAAITVVAFGLPSITNAATLAPHRATYRLSLAPSPETRLGDLRGRLVIEWKATCELWLSYQRMAFVGVQLDGMSFGHDVRYSSAETVDGQSLQFTVRTYQGEDLAESYRGRATLETERGGAAIFIAPEDKRVELPAGSAFPAAHLDDVLKRASRGERLMTHQVFDGWGYDSLVQVTTVIGEPEARKLDGIEQADPAETAWPVSMAYYGEGETPDVPEFEATFLMSGSGVLYELELNYDDLVVGAELAEIELFERPDC